MFFPLTISWNELFVQGTNKEQISGGKKHAMSNKKMILKYVKEFEAILPKMKELLFSEKDTNLHALDITIPQINVLGLLLDKECTMTEMGDKLHLALNTISGHIDRLVRDKLVQRVADANDRRIVRVKLTKKGEEKIKMFFKARRKRLLAVFSNLSRKDMSQVVKNFKSNYRIFQKAASKERKLNEENSRRTGLKKALLSILLIFFVYASANCKTLYDIDKSMALALQNNLSLKQKQQNVLELQWKLSESKASLYPKLLSNTTLTKLQEPRSSSIGDRTILFSSDLQVVSRFSLAMTLYSSGKLQIGKSLIKQNVTLTEIELKLAKQEIIFQVKDVYYKVLQAAHLLEVAEAGVKAAKQHLNVTQNLKQQGALSNYDVLRAQTAVSDAQKKLIQAQNNVSIQKTTFLYVIGAEDLQEDYDLKDIDVKIDVNPLLPSAPAEEAALYAAEHRPEVSLSKLRMAMEKSNMRLEKVTGLPMLNLSANYDFTRGERMPLQWRNVYSVDLNMSMSLYDSGVKSARVQQSAARLKAAEDALEDAKRKVALEVGYAYLQMKEAMARMGNSKNGLEQAKEGLSLAEERYSYGVGTLVEVLDAQTAFESAQSDFYTSFYDFYRALAQIDKAMGKQ